MPVEQGVHAGLLCPGVWGARPSPSMSCFLTVRGFSVVRKGGEKGGREEQGSRQAWRRGREKKYKTKTDRWRDQS